MSDNSHHLKGKGWTQRTQNLGMESTILDALLLPLFFQKRRKSTSAGLPHKSACPPNSQAWRGLDAERDQVEGVISMRLGK